MATGRLTPAEADRLEALIAAFGLPTAPPPVGSTRLAELMRLDKKVAAGRLRFVLFDGLGESAVVDDVEAEDLAAVLARADATEAAS